MKTTFQYFLLATFISFTFSSFSQRGKDGDYVVGGPNTIVNTYTYLTANAPAGATAITVNNNAMTGGVFGGALAPGDLIMVIQMQGAVANIDPRPVTAWGDVYTVPAPYLWSGDWALHIEEFGALNYTDAVGAVVDCYYNSGKFELVEVLSVSGGNTINLQCGLKNTYNTTITNGPFWYTMNTHVQIVRIPRFNNLTVPAGNSIIPTLWNGNDGGVVGLEVDAVLDVNAGGSINADDAGFRGGELDATGLAGSNANPFEVRYLGTNDPSQGSEKGEGIMGYHTEYDQWDSRYGIGAVANGGGGGGFHNSGGGGGSNVYTGAIPYTGNGVPDPAYLAFWNLDYSHPPYTGSGVGQQLGANISPGGGRGGYALADVDQDESVVGPRDASWGADARKTNGGRGGHALTYDQTRLYFGGGGGAGDQDSQQGGAGGRGGGIVYITSYGTITGGGTISANGEDGEKSNPNNENPSGGAVRKGNDGAGGGGAGGSIYIENAAAIGAGISLNAIGGDGGDQDIRLYQFPPFINTGDEAGGPGGAGSGGAIAFNGAAPTQDVSGGAAGTITSQNYDGSTYTPNPSPMMGQFPMNGATDGHNGAASLASTYYDLTGSDVTICAGQVANLSVTVSGTLPAGGTVQWYTQEFGGASVNSGLTYSPSPGATITYYVGVCPGTFRIPIVVTVNSSDDASFVSTDFCASSVNTISGVVTPGGTYSIQSQTGSGGVTIDPSTGVLSNYVAGDQVTIEYTTPAGPCQNTSTQVVNVTGLDDASFTSNDFCASSVNTISGVATPGGTYVIQSQTGSGGVTIDGATGILSNYVAGDQITIEYTTPAGGCQNTSTQVVNVNPADDASFTSGDFCESTVNTISGVATPGGTYAIQSQTGSGGVTIDGATGVLSNYVAGDQITIEYTTPSGGCQSTSTQVVNVTALDDASFTSNDFCESSVNTISGVVTPGGTYAIQSQTGSGSVTIDGATGVLSNYVAGDQVTIEYTTPAGGCQNTSTQIVNVNPLDDASFTSNDFCESSVNTISGVVTPGGTYTIQSQTGSGSVTIDGATGVLSNYVAGDQITIEYTTPVGGCQNTSTQVVNVNAADDASFTSNDFCESSVNTISGVATPGGTYAIQSQTGSGSVTIDGATGVLSNYVAGDQITIEYTTPVGGCQTTSTQVVNVTSLDDASFTSSDFCASSVNTISGVATPGGTFAIQSQTGSGGVTIDGATGVLSNYVAGDQITIAYTTPAGGCQNTSTQVVNVTNLDDATFVSSDFCESSVNTISGVATPGGTYAIQSQTGSGGVTIDGATGVLSNYLAGDQITIEYTTPAGGCQNTSTQVVNVTGLDDASFTSSDFCASSVNTISGVATPGGTYVIQSQTGSGGVTIDGATGVLSNYVAGDQITIEYTTPAGGCQNTSTQVVNVTGLDDASFTSNDFCESSVNTISGVATPGGTYTIQSQTGSGSVTIDGGTGVLSNYVAGDQITIEYTTPAGGCQNTSTQVVNVNPLDDATFTSTDFCESSVNTISGVATPGGIFAIQSQTGSGAVTIDGATGVLSNYVAGDQVTIEYTTPAGGCQNTSLQVVNVTSLDDASFSSFDFCASSVNTISGVVTPGGTFAIQSQTGSGGVTIDGATGVLSNYVAGDQITIEYTTPAGGCQNTSTQIVNVTNLDDASFTSTDFCESGVNSVSAVATPGGTFTIQSQTGSGSVTIDGATGILSNFIAGDQITIEYTTPAGGCQNSSTQIVNVNPLDDASFTSTDFCESSVNTISGVVTPGGSYAIQSQTGSGAVTINGATGVLSNYAAGDQITIEYTTPAGGCQNTSTQVLNVTPLDDASFTSFDFCESSVNTISGVATPGGTFTIQSQTGSGSVTIDGATGILSNFTTGDQITIEYTTPAGGCQNTSTQVVNVTTQDDASFTSTDFCESSVNTISGVATPGGTFTIQSQTGSGSVTIDGATGALSNYVAGDQITIEYTTPAGACQNTSTQVVNVTPMDDASFTTSDFCESSVNTISGVATPGGTFTIQSQTGSGAVTIDGATGVLSNYSAGDQVTIEYSTPAGGCQNTSTQVVNVTALDDASFTVTPTCDGGTVTITGAAGGTFAWDVAPLDAATVDAATGDVTGGNEMTSYSISYTTSGACSNSSVVQFFALDCSVPVPVELVIPTAFTPSPVDGVNDTWEILGLDQLYPDNIVRVYNRWGNMIFEHKSSTSDPYSGSMWDGTYNGQKMPVASYYYVIDFNDGSGDDATGTVTIVQGE